MRGRPSTLPITVNERVLQLLRKQYKKGKIRASFKARVGIILHCEKEESIAQCSRVLGISRKAVNHWRIRWLEEYKNLTLMAEQASVSDQELLDKISQILSDKPRSGKPKRISLSEEQQIVALACTKPSEYGIPLTNWTHKMLAKVVVAENIVSQISSSHIGNILKKRN